jgi:hypothetical protein
MCSSRPKGIRRGRQPIDKEGRKSLVFFLFFFKVLKKDELKKNKKQQKSPLVG